MYLLKIVNKKILYMCKNETLLVIFAQPPFAHAILIKMGETQFDTFSTLRLAALYAI